MKIELNVIPSDESSWSSKKNFYERRAYESVDEKSLS